MLLESPMINPVPSKQLSSTLAVNSSIEDSVTVLNTTEMLLNAPPLEFFQVYVGSLNLSAHDFIIVTFFV